MFNPSEIKSDTKMMCPLVNREIPYYDCFEVTTVAEGTTPKTCIDECFYKADNFETICLNCYYHYD